MMMKKSRRVLKELYIGIAVHAFIFMIIGIIFMKPWWMYAIALIVGALGACGQAYGMYDTLDKALDLTAKGAKSFAMIRSILRLLICMALMIGAIIIHWTAFVGATVGLLGLKISAFINPLVKKLLAKFEGVDDTLDIKQK